MDIRLNVGHAHQSFSICDEYGVGVLAQTSTGHSFTRNHTIHNPILIVISRAELSCSSSQSLSSSANALSVVPLQLIMLRFVAGS